MVLDLVPPSDPILHTPTTKFDFDNPQIDVQQFVTDMSDSLIAYKGLGLSANQVGIPYSMFVFGIPDKNGNPKIAAIFNPKIVDQSGDVLSKEGCLSYPGLFIVVPRYEKVRVRFQRADGEFDTVVFDALTSKIFQHEIDHLNGITFGQKISREKLRMNLKKHSFVVNDFYPKA